MRRVSDEDAKSLLGEGLHTGLRKAADSPEAWEIWKAIGRLDPTEWDEVLQFVVDGLRDSDAGYAVVALDDDKARKWFEIVLCDLDLAAEAAVAVVAAHPEHSPTMHRLVGRLGTMREVLLTVGRHAFGEDAKADAEGETSE